MIFDILVPLVVGFVGGWLACEYLWYGRRRRLHAMQDREIMRYPTFDPEDGKYYENDSDGSEWEIVEYNNRNYFR